MKKYIIPALFLLFIPFVSLAASINLTTNKTDVSTDDILQVRISVDGEVDNGQIGIKGLENFKVVGQSNSSQFQLINGAMTSIQEKILSLAPVKDGTFSLVALAKENGAEVRSDTINITVKKSLIQTTKEKLLTASDQETTATDETQNSLKDLLKSTPTEINTPQSSSVSTVKSLKTPELKTFPKVQHISAFNALFWMELVGILLGLFILFWAGNNFLNRRTKAKI